MVSYRNPHQLLIDYLKEYFGYVDQPQNNDDIENNAIVEKQTRAVIRLMTDAGWGSWATYKAPVDGFWSAYRDDGFVLYRKGDRDPTPARLKQANPDLTDEIPQCGSWGPLGHRCTWEYGHEHPQHIYGTGTHILDIWRARD